MKKLVFEIIHENWELCGPGSWENTIYKIYDDLSIDIEDNYKMIDSPKTIKPEDNQIKISENDYEKIKNLIEEAKNINIEIDACDGDAWEFIYYQDDNIYWKREMNYIYGITVLEEITEIIEKYKNM